jgi:hypothetical protein
MLFNRAVNRWRIAAGLGLALLVWPVASRSQVVGPWSLEIVSALLEDFKDEVLLEKGVVRNISFYLNTQTGAISICLTSAAGRCRAVTPGQANLREKDRFRLVAFPRSANPAAPATTASVAVLDTVTGLTLLCSVTSFESRTETPRNAVCTPIRD